MTEVDKRHHQIVLPAARRPVEMAPPGGPRVLIVTAHGYEEIVLGAELQIGRAFSSGLRLDGDDVSRLHATITRQGEAFILRDMKSRNGVEVNGTKIERHILEPNDVIQVGPHFLLYEPNDSIDLDALLERAAEIMAKARGGTGADADGAAARDLRPGNESWEAGALVRQIERSVRAFSEIVAAADGEAAAARAKGADQAGEAKGGAGAGGDAPAAEAPRAAGRAEGAKGDAKGAGGEGADAVAASVVRAVEPFNKALYLLHETATAFWRQNDWGGLCKEAARVSLDVIGGNKALIMLRRPDEEDMQVGALVTRGRVQSSLITPAVMRFLLEERRVIASGFARDDHRIEEDRALLEAGAIDSILGAPLMLEDDCIGFFYLDAQRGRHRYGAADARMLFTLAEHLVQHLARLL